MKVLFLEKSSLGICDLLKYYYNYFHSNCVHLGPVHTYPDIFESATFSFRIRLPSTRIPRIRQRIQIFFNSLSRVGSISRLFGSPVVYPSPVVWGKERGLKKRLEIEPISRVEKK